jgi:hypothetical protein
MKKKDNCIFEKIMNGMKGKDVVAIEGYLYRDDDCVLVFGDKQAKGWEENGFINVFPLDMLLSDGGNLYGKKIKIIIVEL